MSVLRDPMRVPQQADIDSFPSGAIRMTMVKFIHPANDASFLSLAANDLVAAGVDGNPPKFGLHLGTALLACRIIAFNKPGFLSTSKDRRAPHIATAPRDVLLLAKKYYFHLDDDLPQYPICLDFSTWLFPHEMLLPGTIWTGGPLERGRMPERESDVSLVVKARDGMCLVSLCRDGLTTSHLAPRAMERWLIDNQMEIYAEIENPPVNEDKFNLLTLRADLHLIFNRSAFVFVPKSGQLRVHFLTRAAESGILYHDTPFNDHNRLARAFMLARFGWAVIQLAKRHVQDPELFNFPKDNQDMSNEDGGGDDGYSDGPGGGSRGSHQNESGDESQEPIRKKLKRRHLGNKPTRRSSRKKESHTSLQPKVMLEPDQRDAAELARDLKVAAIAAPYFVDETQSIDPWHYEHMNWYPGVAAIRRKKQAYIENNSQIRATSGPSAAVSDRSFGSD